MQENNNNQYTAIGHGQSQAQIWKQINVEKQHDSSARQPLNAVYSESRDVFKFLHVLAMICLHRQIGKRACMDSHVQCKSSKILVAFITRHAGGKTLLQQDPPVLNSECQLTQVVLYNGGKMVAKLGSESKPMVKYILSPIWHKNHQKTQIWPTCEF